ncbi:MAG TPA: hypothetical protein VNI83_15255 [Vicinamibacterales bacterium]|nr:hypothetical protein [Vicinamibacterales bacterium]
MTHDGGGTLSLISLDVNELWLDDAAAAAGGFPNATAVELIGNPSGGKPGHMGRRVILRSRIPLESFVPTSVRWLRENQGKHVCECGCGELIRLEARHYWRGAPRHVHGHQNFRGHWRVLQLRQAGYLTTSDVARALAIGITTLCRREGTIYPAPSRIGGIRVYRLEDLQTLGGR